MNGPISVPRPPTAVQITPSIENTGPASRKETIPTQAAYIAPGGGGHEGGNAKHEDAVIGDVIAHEFCAHVIVAD